MDLASLQEMIATHGYWALFAGTFMEGETFFVLAGMAARKGLLNPWLVAIIAMAGGFLGDQVFFWLGRWKGMKLVTFSWRVARKAVVARRLIRRNAVTIMLLSRFLYGLRVAIPVSCGVAAIPGWKFALLNFVSALVWCALYGGLGYAFGGLVFDNLDLFKGFFVVLAFLAAVVAASHVLARWLRRRLGAVDPPTSP